MIGLISSLLAQAEWTAPAIDWHAIAPELILVIGINVVLLVDLNLEESKKWMIATLSGFVMLAAFIPVVTLGLELDGVPRELFDGRYVIDEYALVLKALFLLVGYVVVLMSQNELEEGGYYQGEFYVLMLCSILGMVMMASSRDLISIFVALELLSIPGYMMAAWRKRSSVSNEAGVKYYLMGVFASAIMLFGMSYLYGATGTTLLTGPDGIGAALVNGGMNGLEVVGIVFVIVGFAFKVSAVPFHSWAPDTYEGAPTPVTAFFSVASKSAGFVALMTLVFLAFPNASDIYGPMIWVMAALTMTVGNVLALRQTNIVRMLAYSSISQGGFILMPLAYAGVSSSALNAVVVYLLVYAFMNLGAFAVVIAVSRKTHSGEIASFGGLFTYAPGMAVAMTVFMASLAGIPPLGGWFAKFNAFKAVLDADTTSAYVLACIAAVNTVISAAYYFRVLRTVWVDDVPDGNTAPINPPSPIVAALAITVIGTIAVGVYPRLVAGFGNLSDLAGALPG